MGLSYFSNPYRILVSQVCELGALYVLVQLYRMQLRR